MFSSFPDTRCLPISLSSSSTKEAGAGSVYKHLSEPSLRLSSSTILPFSSLKSLRSSLMEFVPALPRHLKTQGHPRKFSLLETQRCRADVRLSLFRLCKGTKDTACCHPSQKLEASRLMSSSSSSSTKKRVAASSMCGLDPQTPLLSKGLSTSFMSISPPSLFP
jgi:hypothetical protein